MRVESLSYHSLVARYPNPLPVVARFRNSAHLRAGRDIITLSAGRYDGPLTVRLPLAVWNGSVFGPTVLLKGSPRLSSGVAPRRDWLDHGISQSACLEIDEIGLSAGRAWDPPVCAASCREDLRLDVVEVVRPHITGSAFFSRHRMGRRLTEARIEALMGATGNDRIVFERGVGSVTGLGPGLTPAGDDWLVGLATSLWHLPSTSWGPSEQAEMCLTTLASNRDLTGTTELSETLLRQAVKGVSAAPLIAFAQSLTTSPQLATEALLPLLSIGETSGADMALGVVDGASLLLPETVRV